jgi:predicted RNA-binding Zn-ribbon protein involved in translation (DUF1610 family)
MFFCPNCANLLIIVNTNNKTSKTSIADTDSLSDSDKVKPSSKSSDTDLILDDKTNVLFKCNNCGYNSPVEPGTKIINLTSVQNKKYKSIDIQKYANMVYDPTLPCTRNYTCINKDCPTHTNPKIKEAVWFKPRINSHYIINICKVCKTLWE